MDIFRQDQVMSGSHGTISIDGEILAEVFEWSAKVKIDRKKINMAGGQTGEKITGTSGEGTIKRYKVKKYIEMGRSNETKNFSVYSYNVFQFF